MMSVQDIQLYLPKYLSEDNYRNLLKELESFPNNIDQRMYTTSLPNNVIFQGDGYDSLPFVNLMKIEDGCKYRSGIVLSNTCDMAPENRRLYSSSIIYAPIMDLKKYVENLQIKNIREDVIKNHVTDIRKQAITSMLFLPANSKMPDSIVFLNRITSVDNSYFSREELNKKRLFSLSDYGFYMLLFKLSVHFSRIQEKVNRGHL
jgi:hypothetical protein